MTEPKRIKGYTVRETAAVGFVIVETPLTEQDDAWWAELRASVRRRREENNAMLDRAMKRKD